MKWVSVALVTMLLLAGCLHSDRGAEDHDPSSERTSEDRTLQESVDWGATGCSLAVGAFVVPFNHLETFLPDGFRPADAAGLLGAPAPVGEGAALLTAYACDEHVATNGTFVGAEINILVEDPELDNAPVDAHYYLAQLVLPAGPELDMLIADGWNTIAGDVAVAAGVPMASDVRTDVQEYSLEVVGLAPSSLEGLSRFWHITPQGPSWFDYDVTADVQAGSVQATWDSGTLADEIAGEATTSLGIAVPRFGWSAAYQPPN